MIKRNNINKKSIGTKHYWDFIIHASIHVPNKSMSLATVNTL